MRAMPELLLELFSEEIPARMQPKAADDLKSLLTGALVDSGLLYEGAQAHATPRRLVVSVEGLPAQTPIVLEERRGPRVDAPQPAIEGFLRSTGLSLNELKIEEDKKGSFYVASTSKPGRPAADLIGEIVPDLIRKFPWPKSMRWGAGSLRWVRPLRSILCTFEGEVVSFELDGIRSGNITRGHRFMSSGTISVHRFADYARKLHEAKVVVSSEVRAETIRAEAQNLAFAQGFELITDEALLEETAGLAEWPVVLMGSFDSRFLGMPPEVIATSIKTHQKCFALRLGGNAGLANRYILVSNMVARDGGKEIVRGNDKVIAARLADAQFFWDHDRAAPLEKLLPKLDQVTFHAKLGSQGERVRRIEALAGEIGKAIGADAEKAQLAARLCKADLVTGMVGEFPELQGLMGRYYALAQGMDVDVADAIRDHYKPQGPSDTIPAPPIGRAVALADKIDTLASFWAIGQVPTGSKDPFALRRAALGIIRVLIESQIKLPLSAPFGLAYGRLIRQGIGIEPEPQAEMAVQADHPARRFMAQLEAQLGGAEAGDAKRLAWQSFMGVLSFLADRLKIYLREEGKRHDLIDAVFSLGDQDDLLLIVKRVEALSSFLATDDGSNLLIGVKRATNILRIEEKKDGVSYGTNVERHRLIKAEEIALHSAVTVASGQAHAAVEHEDFGAAMTAIAKLRTPVDQFFDRVTVNDRDPGFRENRLKLLNRIRAATLEVADFSKIEG
jgi:glycyl-tRNA synthetase beta chain